MAHSTSKRQLSDGHDTLLMDQSNPQRDHANDLQTLHRKVGRGMASNL